MNENNEHIRIWPAGLTGNMDGIPKIRPERVLRQRYIGTTNNADDKMNKTMTKNPLITQEQVEDIINTKYPDHADYWLHGANKKHTEIVINARCDKCGHQERFTIKHRSDLKRLLKRNCAGCEMKEAKRNKHLNIPLPFGKYRGKTINAVMLEKPSYLAWMVDEIEDEDELIEKIKSHSRFPEVWAAYEEKKVKWVRKVIQEAHEWQQGRFSKQTVDDVCDTLFQVRVYKEEDGAG